MVASSGGFVIAVGDLSACLPESSATAAGPLGRLPISRLSLPDPDRAIKTDAGAGRPSRPHSAQMRVSSLMRPSARCRRPGPISFHDPVHASTSSSNDGSRRRSSCLLQRPPPCCSGPCLPPDRSTCVRWMAGRRSTPGSSISQLTSQLDQLPSM